MQTRSFQYVDDLVEGMIRTMGTDKSFSGPVNIGNPGEYTILELAKKIIKMTNSQSKIIFKQLPTDDPLMRKPDISYAKKELKWEPLINLDEGLEKTITYFRKIMGIETQNYEEKNISYRRRGNNDSFNRVFLG